MYRAKFCWLQNTKTPIYEKVIGPYLKDRELVSISDGGITQGALEKVIVTLDIPEDFTYEIKSNFQNYAEAVGSVSSIAGSILGFFEKLNTLSAIGGKSSNSSEYMKFQVWKDTEPFRMSFKFLLETKTDPFIDVYAPATALCSMAILSPVVDSKTNQTVFYTPGVNSGSTKALSREGNNNAVTPKKTKSGRNKQNDTVDSADTAKPSEELLAAWNKSSKLLSEFLILSSRVDGDTGVLELPQGQSGTFDREGEIPLLIINNAFIESCKPTWSKDRTTSGIPLRCELEVTVQSVFSAHDEMFGYLSKSSTLGASFGDQAAIVATNIFR